MKKAFILSLLIVALFAACDKNKDAKPVPSGSVGQVSASDIAGEWLPVSVSGLNGEWEAMPDIYHYYTFNVNGTYVNYFSPQTQYPGTFHIGRATSIVDGKTYSAISFGTSPTQSILALKNDTLTISDNFAGGSKYFYVRIN